MTSDSSASALVSLLTKLRNQAPDIVDAHLEEFGRLAAKLDGVGRDYAVSDAGRHVARELRDWWDSVGDGLRPTPAQQDMLPASEPSAAGEQRVMLPTPDAGLAPGEDGEPMEEPERECVDRKRVHQALVRVWDELRDDAEARPYLGDLGEPAGDPAALWKELHLTFWRLSTQEVEQWTRRARERCAEFGLPDEAGPANSETDVVVPAFDLIDCPELRLGPSDAEQRKWVLESLGTGGAERFPELAAALADVLLLLEEDKHARVGWHAVYKKRELGGWQHRRYVRSNLQHRLQRLATTKSGDAAEFQELVDLDEAVRSIVYDPLPHKSSWWAKNVGNLYSWMESRSQAGRQINELTGPYNNHDKLTDPTKDIAKPSVARRGWVLWTLRMWSEVDGKASLGRVIYAPSES